MVRNWGAPRKLGAHPTKNYWAWRATAACDRRASTAARYSYRNRDSLAAPAAKRCGPLPRSTRGNRLSLASQRVRIGSCRADRLFQLSLSNRTFVQPTMLLEMVASDFGELVEHRKQVTIRALEVEAGLPLLPRQQRL